MQVLPIKLDIRSSNNYMKIKLILIKTSKSFIQILSLTIIAIF